MNAPKFEELVEMRDRVIAGRREVGEIILRLEGFSADLHAITLEFTDWLERGGPLESPQPLLPDAEGRN